jgi:hypothetical protein
MPALDAWTPDGWAPSPWMEACRERDELRALLRDVQRYAHRLPGDLHGAIDTALYAAREALEKP